MPREYTKYYVSGLEQGLNKRELIFSIVKHWIEKSKSVFEELMESFPNKLQAGFGVVKRESDTKTTSDTVRESL